jgi:hypothetical protein
MRPDKLRLQQQEGHAADAAVETSLHRAKIKNHLHVYSRLHSTHAAEWHERVFKAVAYRCMTRARGDLECEVSHADSTLGVADSLLCRLQCAAIGTSCIADSVFVTVNLAFLVRHKIIADRHKEPLNFGSRQLSLLHRKGLRHAVLHSDQKGSAQVVNQILADAFAHSECVLAGVQR